MTTRNLLRIALAILALVGIQVGLWAAFFPRAFYDDFPGASRIWVAVDGPYNEHLVRDVGALNLALAVVAIVALVTLSRAAVIAAGGAWLAYGLPHFVYHLRHLEPLAAGDDVAVAFSLGINVLLAAVVLWTGVRNPGEALS